MNKKLILVDVDGVLLNWEYAFTVWMEARGYKQASDTQFTYGIDKRFNLTPLKKAELVRTFNESAAIGFLPPLRDAVHYVKKIHEKYGYQFRVITSLSLDENAQALRVQNLEKLFGEAVFEGFTFLDTGADKDDALSVYKDTELFWIEDKLENAIAGQNQGLNAVLMEHGHNMFNTDIKLIKNWKEFYYEFIVNIA